jgi:hypothetical protein
MKIVLSYCCSILCFACAAQNVGVGTVFPQAKLHVRNDFEVLRLQGQSQFLSFYDNLGNYTGFLWNNNNTSIELGTPAGSGFPVRISPGLLPAASFLPTGYVGIGVTNPLYRLDVNGRMLIRHFAETAGIWFNNSTNTSAPGFVGLVNDNEIGFWGGVAGWSVRTNTNNGNTGFGVAPDDNAKLYTEGTTALYTKGSFTTSTALKIGRGKLVVENAGVNTTTNVFVHKATAANTPDPGGYTVIDHPLCNNNPSAILIVTMNGTYGSGAGEGFNTPPEHIGSGPGSPQIVSTTSFMVVYNGPGSVYYAAASAFARDKWLIRTYAGQSVSSPLNFNFNVMIVNPN